MYVIVGIMKLIIIIITFIRIRVSKKFSYCCSVQDFLNH